MALRRLAHDYYHAICSAHSDRSGLATAIWSVALARLHYNIGPRYHSLFQLNARPRTQWPDYLIDDSLKPLLKTVNAAPARAQVRDKLFFYQHCLRHELATVPVIHTFDPRNIDVDVIEQAAIDEFASALDTGGDDLFFKLIDGSWGAGAFAARRVGQACWRVEGKDYAPRALLAFCKQRYEETDPESKGWMVQPTVQNHHQLRTTLAPAALSTVRLVTIAETNNIHVLLGVIRLPTGQNSTDNFAHGSSGNLVAPMDLTSGKVGTAWTSQSRAWPRMAAVDKHPDTGAPIAGSQLPDWAAALDLVQAAHMSFPDLKTVGWDVAFTDQGPVIVEANGQFDVDLLQVALNQGLASTLMPRLLPSVPTPQEPTPP